MSSSSDFLVVGAGIFGVTTALSLRSRGYSVTLIDPGPLPYPLAASTDVSKVVRMEYGSNRQYMRMVIRAIEGFHRWNELFEETLYHETGVLVVAKDQLSDSEFIDGSYQMLLEEGQRPERLSAAELRRRFPAWTTGAYVDGFYHARGGYAESGRVVGKLVEQAAAAGVDVRPGQTADQLKMTGSRVQGIATREGATFSADHTVLAAGSWTPWLLPELQPVMKATGHPIFHSNREIRHRLRRLTLSSSWPIRPARAGTDSRCCAKALLRSHDTESALHSTRSRTSGPYMRRILPSYASSWRTHSLRSWMPK